MSKKLLDASTLIGQYTHYNDCRFCFSNNLIPVISLGNMPLAGGFLKDIKKNLLEKFYPLELAFCQTCFLLQSVNVIDKDILFQDYYYHTSAIQTLNTHFTNAAEDFIKTLPHPKKAFIVEIGSNDGAFIHAVVKHGIRTLGIDPATNIVAPLIKKGIPIRNDYFSEEVAKSVYKEYGMADIICSFNTLAHIENMHDVMKGVIRLLKRDGSLIFETHYLGKLLQELQYDMIYHEHQYYYSLITLQNFFSQYEMEIYDVLPISIHAGSMRYYVQFKNAGKNSVTNKVKNLRQQELKQKFNTANPYLSFSNRMKKRKEQLLSLLLQLKNKHVRIGGYGASGRGTVIMNYCGLDKTLLEYVIDDAPAKIGAYTPGMHHTIVKSDVLRSKDKPDYVLLFAWSFFPELKKRNQFYWENGGKFIFPLPKVAVVAKHDKNR